MARRTVFTDLSTGRFVSAADAGELESVLRSVYDGGLVEQQRLTFGRVESVDAELAGSLPDLTESRWGARMFDPDGPLDLSALAESEMPDGFDAFRVTYNIPNNPDYPRPFASSEWLSADQWPPSLDLLQDVGPTGIAHIVFRRDMPNA